MTKLEHKTKTIEIRHKGNGLDESYETEILTLYESTYTLGQIENLCRKVYNYGKYDTLASLHSEWDHFRDCMDLHL